MKIDKTLIDKIYLLKVKLKSKKEKVKLSEYEEYIPMYDIYTEKIYPIYKLNLHYRIFVNHFRFINDNIYDWITNLYNKNKGTDKETFFKYNLDILDNYIIDILIDTSYKTLYKFSPELGLAVSICKRNSFHPYIYHLKPYYSRIELIKLGQNMKLLGSNLDINNLDIKYLSDNQLQYNICKLVSKNDVSFEEIKRHHSYIHDNKLTSWICYYTYYGSYVYNRLLRFNDSTLLTPVLSHGLINILNHAKNTPPLDKRYNMYRFVKNDSFLANLNVGDIFVDTGFMSMTRDPFYKPGEMGSFGLILVKIIIPPNIKGVGIFLENYSLFPLEQEFLIFPNSKFRVISKEDKFKYYHTTEKFEKKIISQYEIEFLNSDPHGYKTIKNIIKIHNNTHIYTLKDIKIHGIDRISLIKDFIKKYSHNNIINIGYNKKVYSFHHNYFDIRASFEHVYYNNYSCGFIFIIFNTEGYPELNIEMGNDMMVNYLNSKYYSNNYAKIDIDQINLIYELGLLFNYETCKIYHTFRSLLDFKNNYNESDHLFLTCNLYNHTIYNYIKNNKKYHIIDSYLKYTVGYEYLDFFFDKYIETRNLPFEIFDCYTFKELFIKSVEGNYFNLYKIIIENLDEIIKDTQYMTYSIYEKAKDTNNHKKFKLNFKHEYNNKKSSLI